MSFLFELFLFYFELYWTLFLILFLFLFLSISEIIEQAKLHYVYAT